MSTSEKNTALRNKALALFEQLSDRNQQKIMRTLKYWIKKPDSVTLDKDGTITFDETTPSSVFFLDKMKDEFRIAKHMINVVMEGARCEDRPADEYISGTSISVTLNHALEILVGVDHKIDLMHDELLLLLNPDREPVIPDPNYQSKEHWLDR